MFFLKVRTKIAFLGFLAIIFSNSLYAGLFDDVEARAWIKTLDQRQAEDLKRVEAIEEKAKVQTVQQSGLARQIEVLTNELRGLRGEIEVLTNKLDINQKLNQEIQADARLRKIEGGSIDIESRLHKLETLSVSLMAEQTKTATVASANDAEQKAYAVGLDMVKANNYNGALNAFGGFLKAYPSGTLAASAQYWVGNSHYAMRSFPEAIAAYTKLIELWPGDTRAPDAMLNLAAAQADAKEKEEARLTLNNLVRKYPDADAAKTARERLKKPL